MDRKSGKVLRESRMQSTPPKAIGLNPSDEDMQRYVSNIVTVFNSASPDQERRGRTWYQTAHDMAEMISGGDVVAGAGVLAALSPQTSWDENVKRAARAFAEGKPSGHTGANLVKAARCMAGEDPATVLPMESKTGHFYRCIVDPDTQDAVCIDRHAHDVAVGERWGDDVDRGLGSKKRYAILANAYREAARVLGVSPATVQAVAWVVQVDEFRWTRATSKIKKEVIVK